MTTTETNTVRLKDLRAGDRVRLVTEYEVIENSLGGKFIRSSAGFDLGQYAIDTADEATVVSQSLKKGDLFRDAEGDLFLRLGENRNHLLQWIDGTPALGFDDPLTVPFTDSELVQPLQILDI